MLHTCCVCGENAVGKTVWLNSITTAVDLCLLIITISVTLSILSCFLSEVIVSLHWF